MTAMRHGVEKGSYGQDQPSNIKKPNQPVRSRSRLIDSSERGDEINHSEGVTNVCQEVGIIARAMK